MLPALGASSPASIASSVVLPAPFGPITACTSAANKSRSTRSTATRPPNRLLRLDARNAGSGMLNAPRSQGLRQIRHDAVGCRDHDRDHDQANADQPVLGRAL